MGLAERADLVARLTLEDKFTGPISRVESKLGSLDKRLGGIARSTSFVGRTLSTAFGVALDRAISAGIGALSGAIRGGNASLEELEAVTLRTSAVIKSTGGVAGVTAAQVRTLAESMEDLSTFDDKAIQNTENLLLTFTSITKEGFKPALQAVLDMNAALGGGDEGLQGVAIQVGKALQDPIRGLTALRRVGVAFSDAQQDQIKNLVKEGRLFEAQKIILAELNKEFGGQAGAFGKGRAADVRRLADAVEDFQRRLAEGLAPAVDAARKGLTQLLKDPAVLQAVGDLGKGIASLFSPANIKSGLDAVRGVISTIRDFAPVIKDAAQVTGGILRTAVDLFKSLPPELRTAAIVALTANKLTGGAIGGVAKGLLELGLKGLRTIFAGNVTVIGSNVIGGAAGGVVSGGGGLISKVAVIGAIAIAAGSLIELVKVFNANREGFKVQGEVIGHAVSEQIKQGATADLETSRRAILTALDTLGASPENQLGGLPRRLAATLSGAGDEIEDLLRQLKAIDAEIAARRGGAPPGSTSPSPLRPPRQQGIAPDERAGQALLDRLARGAPFRLATTGSAAARPVNFEFSPAALSTLRDQKTATDTVRDRIEATRIAIQSLVIPAPVVIVNVTARTVTHTQTQYKRAGNTGRLHAC